MLCSRHVNALAVVMVEKFFRRAKAVDSTGVVVAAVAAPPQEPEQQQEEGAVGGPCSVKDSKREKLL